MKEVDFWRNLYEVCCSLILIMQTFKSPVRYICLVACIPSSVTNGWFSSILSFITRGSTLWRLLVSNQIWLTSLRVMYSCCSTVSEARFSNQHGGMYWRSVLFYSYYILDDWDYQLVYLLLNLMKCKRILTVYYCCGFIISTEMLV